MELLELKDGEEAYLVNQLVLPPTSIDYCGANKARNFFWYDNKFLQLDNSILLPPGTRVKMINTNGGSTCVAFPDMKTGWTEGGLAAFKLDWKYDTTVYKTELSEDMRWYMKRNTWENIEVTEHIPSLKEVRRHGRFLDL